MQESNIKNQNDPSSQGYGRADKSKFKIICKKHLYICIDL